MGAPGPYTTRRNGKAESKQLFACAGFGLFKQLVLIVALCVASVSSCSCLPLSVGGRISPVTSVVERQCECSRHLRVLRGGGNAKDLFELQDEVRRELRQKGYILPKNEPSELDSPSVSDADICHAQACSEPPLETLSSQEPTATDAAAGGT